MAADIWRVPSSKVHRGSGMSVIMDRGTLAGAQPAHDPSTGRLSYVFSDLNAFARRPLALIGEWHEIGTWLAARSDVMLVNKIPELSAIYMGACFYKPAHRYKGLFPLQDAAVKLTEGAFAIGLQGLGELETASTELGHTLTEAFSGLKEAFRLRRDIFGSKKKAKAMNLNSTEVYLLLSYLPAGENSIKVGAGAVPFADLTVPALKLMKAL